MTVLLPRERWHVNAKRIYRLYREQRLIVRTKQRRKLARPQGSVSVAIVIGSNHRCSINFLTDKLADGRSFRILTVVDPFTRECVGLEEDVSMTGRKVTEVLERIREESITVRVLGSHG